MSSADHKRQKIISYSTEDSHVVTHRSTNTAIRSLTVGEQTGSCTVFYLWPYVKVMHCIILLSPSHWQSIPYTLTQFKVLSRYDSINTHWQHQHPSTYAYQS
ncbi:hypothetical protein BJ508DRAFT_349659 [Ascobolus immersus RN42]|uniref:Uncharacterized protein n=1 Tax=Ascobolus immersus RN42 TaxID=1160509 RepID=A0A3N4IK70_ASCIM|nr:hypothetical protein BJ508DRAFT_349659 [Ascobolus immersus RN42]